MNPAPTEEVFFLLRWWQEILTGLVVIASGALLKAKGQKDPVYLSEKEISTRMTICKQEILLGLNEILNQRDEKLIGIMRQILAEHAKYTENK